MNHDSRGSLVATPVVVVRAHPARISLLCVVGRRRDTRSGARWIADHKARCSRVRLYLCPAVLLGIREVATTISSRQKFCAVGSGSLVIEAWVLETTTELDVVSFDLFVTEHQRRIAERLRAVYDSSRWTQVRGAFENSTEHVRCGAIVFDTNIRGHLNRLHWKKNRGIAHAGKSSHVDSTEQLGRFQNVLRIFWLRVSASRYHENERRLLLPGHERRSQ